MSLFEEIDLNPAYITAVDFSTVAIHKAQNFSQITYELLDITQANALLKNEYDLIFDSHCLHCIEDKHQRIRAFNNILEALKEEGIMAAEMMVQPSGKNIIRPYKYIPTARELEVELLEAGFKIIYFMIVQDLLFEHENGESDLLRVICRK